MTQPGTISAVKRLVKRSPLYPFVQSGLESWYSRRELARWVAGGSSGAPPHRVKQGVLKAHARHFGLQTLVETGTYLGGMVDAVLRDFERIHTIEVDGPLSEAARCRFARHRHVTVHHGDSSTVLPEVLATLDRPALFWLDGHYSGGFTSMGAKETPIREELEAIFEHAVRRHVILIDDARCFGVEPDYPPLEDLRASIAARRPDLTFTLEHDIIRLTPRG